MNTIRYILSLICGVLIISCSNINFLLNKDHSQTPASIHIPAKKFTLKNGLRLIVSENKALPIFSYYSFYNIGGRHEGKGTTGASHLLEHMMFKGAKKYGPGQFDALINGNGGQNNAYTTFDNTVYYQSVPSNILELVVDIEADRMSNLLLNKESFENERNVVFEERKMRYENSPNGKIYLKMMQNFFEKTPYGGSVIGSVKDLKELTREQVREFFKNFYTPDNTVIIVVGDVDANYVYSLFNKYYGKLRPSTREIREYKKEKDKIEKYRFKGRYRRHVRIYGNSNVPLIKFAFKGEPYGTKKSFVMDILSLILASGESSPLYQKYVRSRKPYLTKISSYNYGLRYSGIFFISGELAPKIGINSFYRKIKRDSRKFCNYVTKRNVSKAKNNMMIDYYKAIETNRGIASILGTGEQYFDDYSYYKKEIEFINSISIEDVKEVCREMFYEKPDYLFLSLWNKHRK